ncbi:MAG: hypothetical protein IKY76_04200 [Alistipes sp.]|nr:hypothetical protein [Alistipes sp.]
MKKIFLLAITIAIFYGCKESSPEVKDEHTKVTSHYITNYLVASEIAVDNKNGTLCLKVSGEEYNTLHEVSEKALELANLYNDNYCKIGVHPGEAPALAYPIEKISISCDSDFDAEHPAGESLDDIAQLGFCSFYPFIKNGYKHFSLTDDWRYGDRVCYTMPFSSVNADVTKLLWAYFTTSKISPSYVAKIEFTSQPEKAGEYTFTIEMTTNGETFETTFTHTFE